MDQTLHDQICDTQIPPSGQIPIDTVLDSDEALKTCLIMGFTLDGNHIISITEAATTASCGRDGTHLQVSISVCRECAQYGNG